MKKYHKVKRSRSGNYEAINEGKLLTLSSCNEKRMSQHTLQAQIMRIIGHQIIDFLTQVDDLQKRLFEKKKFVIRTEYCITIGRLPEMLWNEVLQNKDQLAEWWQLYGLVLQPTKEFLREHPYLVVDTCYFSEDFKWRLLGCFDDLDEALDGLLVKSENFQALNLLLERYRGQVKCIYIDPPYNTGSDGFAYKDSYQHSSWLTMLKSRLGLAHSVLSDAGAIFVSNDENEYAKLRHMLNELFGAQFIENLVWRKKSGGGQTDEYFVTEHDYITCYAKKKGVFSIREKTLEESTEGYPLFDEKKRKRYKRVKLAKWGTGAHKEDRPTMYFPLESPDGEECYPVAPDGRPGRWRYGKTAVIQMVENGDIDWVKNEDSWIPYEKVYEPEKGDLSILKERSILYDLVENAAGSNELKALFGIKDVFPNPKPSDLIHHLSMLVTNPDGEIVLDFFAGSGTTAHAVINLNREDGGRRKYILVEMGDYFETVLLPRIKKVVYSDNWKDGKPQKGKGISHFFKYLYLEQYEDTLNNLDLTTRKQEGQLALKRFGDEYLLRYMLDFETQSNPSMLNIKECQDPFNCKLNVREDNEIRERVVDLVATFNYLLGIHVKKMRQFQDNGRLYRAVLGEKNNKSIVAVWRTLKGLNENKTALRQDQQFIEGTVLPALLGEGMKPDRLLVNGNCYVPKAKSIEPEFKQLVGMDR